MPSNMSHSYKLRSIGKSVPVKKHKAVAVVEDFPSCFGKKVSLGRASCSQRNKHVQDEHPPVLTSHSLKNPHANESKEDWPDYYYRPVENCPREAKKRTRSFFNILSDEEEEAMQSKVIGVVDERSRIEAMKRKVDMDEIFFGGLEGLKSSSHMYATAAISYLNDQGHNLELVKAGSFESGRNALTRGRVHHNFKAKKADDPSAPVETYFAQLSDWSSTTVECCVSLGESDSLPYERDNQGCEYCSKFVHHPVGGCDGIIWGRFILVAEENNFVIE